MKKENKKNRIRIVSLFSVLSVFGFALATPVNADQQCHYKDYYFFNEINKKTLIDDKKSAMEDEKTDWFRQHKTYFPIAKDLSNFTSQRICLRKDDSDNISCKDFGGTIWNLDEFYNAYKLAATEGENVDYTIYPDDVETKTSSSKVKIVKDEANEITRYLTHGKWYKVDANDEETEGGDGVNLGQSKVSDMINASLLPSTIDFSSNFDNTPGNKIREHGSIQIKIKRYINIKTNTINNAALANPFSVVWHPNEDAQASILAPALYYVEYDASCEKYQATIDYFYAGTTDRVEFKNDEANPYVETGLDNGYSKEVKSPELKGCTSSKDVTIKIDGEDFYDVVYYSCDLKEPPKTGDALIYVAWVVGLGALGYASYYLYKNRKPKEEK